MSEEQAAATEVSSVSSGIEDAQPTSAENQERKPDAGNQQQKNAEQSQDKPEKFSRQHKVYLKQQAELRKEREAFEAERNQTKAQLEQQQKELERYKAWQEQTSKGNPWQFLHDNGYDLLKLQQLAVEYDNDPNIVAKNMAEQIRKEQDEKWGAKFAELEKQREEAEHAAIDQHNNARQQHVLGEIGQLLQANPEKYELTAATGNGHERILNIIWEGYQMSDGQSVLSYEQAADALEQALEEEQFKNNKLFQTKKAKKILLGSDSEDVVTTERKKSADGERRSKSTNRASQRQSEPRTLSAKMASATTPGTAGKETFAERKERLARELAAGTWKPKPEYITPVPMNKN